MSLPHWILYMYENISTFLHNYCGRNLAMSPLISFFSNKIRAAGFSVSTVNQERDVDATHMLFLTLATVLQRLWGALPSLSTATVQVTVAV